MADGPKYPNIEVQLSGEDGNVFYIIGKIGKALRRHVDVATEKEWTAEAFASKSYDEVLTKALDWVCIS